MTPKCAPVTGDLSRHGRPLTRDEYKRVEPRSVAGTVYDAGGARRWRMKRAAEGILSDKEPRIGPQGEKRMHFTYRVAMCHRGTDGAPPAIKRSPDRLHARYSGLQSCGSVWHCPICAPKVAAGRRDEMNAAIGAHVNAGGEVYFLTFTMQHDAEKFGAGKLDAELVELKAALSRLKGAREFRELRARVGAIGTIRALETTYGEFNGWHCHTHELMFADAGKMRALRAIRGMWARLLIKRGLAGLQPGDIGLGKFRKLRALLRRCFTVQDGRYAAEYVAKYGKEPENERGGSWGIGSEMTRSHMKQGRGSDDGRPARCDHASPWRLLNDYVDGDKRSGDLWREFALAFHGSAQLYWSPGLKKHFFGTVGRSDDELAAAPDVRCTEYVCALHGGAWARVLEHDARHDLLRVAAVEGADGVRKFIEELERGGRPLSLVDRASGYYEEGRAVFLTRRAA